MNLPEKVTLTNNKGQSDIVTHKTSNEIKDYLSAFLLCIKSIMFCQVNQCPVRQQGMIVNYNKWCHN
jgi:hypothetical protein